MPQKQTPLRPYFEKMPDIGKPLSDGEIRRSQENVELIKEQEKILAAEVERVRNAGIPAERVHDRGGMTVYDRLDYLVDDGTWCPLHSLYNPTDNEEGCTGVVNGLGKIEGKWAVIIGFDNKVMAGAWIAGQAENILMVTDLAKRLNVPLVWLTNCSGVKLMEQEAVYAGRRSSGAPFYRHAELNRLGIPILNAIYGTNPAGGGYQGISPTILLAHDKANIAVGGAGIVGGMNPRGEVDVESALALVEASRGVRAKPPGRVETHFYQTAYFREVHEDEQGVLDGIKDYMRMQPAYDPAMFRVAEPAEPKYPADDLNLILPAKSRHCHLSQIQVALAMIFHDRRDALHDLVHDAWRNHDAPFVGEKHVLFSWPVHGSRDATHRVERPRHVGQLPLATNHAVCPFELRFAAAVLVNALAFRTDKVFARQIGRGLSI